MTQDVQPTEPASPPRLAWEPLTPKGVAEFATSRIGRLLCVQFLVAVLAALTVMWFLNRGWFPVVREAIHQMPPNGEMRHGKLDWSADSSMQLAQNPFLGISVDLFHSGKIGREAHLQVEFGAENLRLYSMFGYQVFDYDAGWNFGFNQPDLEPWWGAWEPMFLVGSAIATIIALMISWTALATVYCAPVWVISFLLNRDLGWGQSWKLAGACLMPGALFLTFGIFSYGMHWMDLIHLGSMMALHFVVGWIYIFITPFFCRKVPAAEKAALRENPFIKPTADVAATKSETETNAKTKNPFS